MDEPPVKQFKSAASGAWRAPESVSVAEPRGPRRAGGMAAAILAAAGLMGLLWLAGARGTVSSATSQRPARAVPRGGQPTTRAGSTFSGSVAPANAGLHVLDAAPFELDGQVVAAHAGGALVRTPEGAFVIEGDAAPRGAGTAVKMKVRAVRREGDITCCEPVR